MKPRLMPCRTLEELDGSEAKLMLLDLPPLDVDRVSDFYAGEYVLILKHDSYCRTLLIFELPIHCHDLYKSRRDRCTIIMKPGETRTSKI